MTKEEFADGLFERIDLYELYDMAYRYYYFVMHCPTDDARHVLLQDNTMNLTYKFRNVCLDSTDIQLKDYGRAGYWFMTAINALLNDPENDILLENVQFRFSALVKAKDTVAW